jgi:hypothetical protein
MAENDDEPDCGTGAVIGFPQSRVKPPGGKQPFTNLGHSPLAASLGAPVAQATGHWCSRCQGIWFGYVLEVTCPRCGNRHG